MAIRIGPGARRARRSALALLLALTAAPGAALAEEKGVSPSRLKLPSGPGSLGGIGEDAEPNLAMGLMTYGVALSWPAGYAGLGPEVRLSYSSGGGNSEVGLGWSLGLPFVERMTSRGLPRYDAGDTFATQGGGELRAVDGKGTYRARFEGGFVRYAWVDSQGGTGGYWLAEYPDGRRGYFGARASGELDAQARVEGPDGTFRYHLCEVVDALGRSIRYEYSKDGSSSLLKRVAYVFVGGKPRYEAEFSYEARPDELSDGKPGFDLRLGQRLREVRVLSRGQPLRRYALAYSDETAGSDLSKLARVRQYGRDDQQPLPVEFTFGYTGDEAAACEGGAGCDGPRVYQAAGAPGGGFASSNADFLDVNGDGLIDVLDTSQAQHRFFLNQPSAADQPPTFAAPKTSAQGTAGFSLSSAAVQPLDVDGDGLADLLSGVDAQAPQVLRNLGASGDWAKPATLPAGAVPDFVGDKYLRFFDADNDRRIDVLRSDGTSTSLQRNQGDAGFAAAQPLDDLGISLTEAQIADMNGDGLQDVVRLIDGQIAYRMSLGHGRFSGWIELQDAPAGAASSLRLLDMNGDGLSDAVRVEGAQVTWWQNKAGRRFRPAQSLTAAEAPGLPELGPGVSLRFADLNGNGSTDIAWISAGGAVSFLDLRPSRPNLLRSIRNGIGQVIEVTYGTSTRHMARDQAEDPWASLLPYPTLTVDQIDTYDTRSQRKRRQSFRYHDPFYDGQEKQFRGFARVDAQTDGDESVEPLLARHRFDVGRSEPWRHGLLLSQETRSAGELLSSVEHSYGDCPVAGAEGAEVHFPCRSESATVLAERRPEAERARTRVRYGYDGYGNTVQVQDEGVVSVGGGACAPCGPDAVGPCGPGCQGDERLEETSFIGPEGASGRWSVRSPLARRSGGAEGSPSAKQERFYYDGEAFVGLPLGQLGAGLLTRREALLAPGQFVDVERLAHDADGDDQGAVVASLDPTGNRRDYGYDEAGLLLTQETIRLDKQGYALRMEVSYDPVLDLITSASSWASTAPGAPPAGEPTRYGYDAFGRISSIAYPGDGDDPSESFTYELGDPVSRIVRSVRSGTDVSDDTKEVQCFDGRGRKFETRSSINRSFYLVTNHIILDAAGNAARAYQPFVASGADCSPTEPPGVLFESTRRDASGRTLEHTLPDSASFGGTASVRRTIHGPLWTEEHDEEDTAQGGPYFGTPSRALRDGLGRVVASERHLPDRVVRIAYTYDEHGRITGYIDAAGNRKKQTYDLLDRITRVDDPDTGITAYDYDSSGRLVARTDARGVTVRRAYDEAGRIVAEWDQADEAGTAVRTFYDRVEGCTEGLCANGSGRLLRITFPLDGTTGVDEVSYDGRGQIVRSARKLDGRTFIIDNVYDNSGRIVATRYPQGQEVHYGRDGLGRPTSLEGFFDEFTYDDRGLLASARATNQTRTSYEYDERMLPRAILTEGPGGTRLVDLRYHRDRAGNIVRVEDGSPLDDSPSARAEYAYDALYRLSAAKLDPQRPQAETLAFSFDDVGNITSKTSDRGAASQAHVGAYTYGAQHPHAPQKAGDSELQHDAAGYLTRRGDDLFTWDHLGRLTRATSGNQELGRYLYAAGSDRVKKIEKGQTTYYLGPDIEVRDGMVTVLLRLSGQPLARFEYPLSPPGLLPDVAPAQIAGAQASPAPDGRISAADAWIAQASSAGLLTTPTPLSSSQVEELLAAAARAAVTSTPSQITFFHDDHQGSILVSSDKDGRPLQRTTHYPYGAVRWASRGRPEDHDYAGKERDASGLIYYGARSSDPRLAIFISADPAYSLLGAPSLRSPSPYQLLDNNPIGLIDPDGFDPKGALVFKIPLVAYAVRITANSDTRSVAISKADPKNPGSFKDWFAISSTLRDNSDDSVTITLGVELPLNSKESGKAVLGYTQNHRGDYEVSGDLDIKVDLRKKTPQPAPAENDKKEIAAGGFSKKFDLWGSVGLGFTFGSNDKASVVELRSRGSAGITAGGKIYSRIGDIAGLKANASAGGEVRNRFSFGNDGSVSHRADFDAKVELGAEGNIGALGGSAKGEKVENHTESTSF